MEKKHEIDMTSGPLAVHILLFSLPLMMSQILEGLFNLSDVAIAGKFADYRALGSVGSTTLLGTKDELIDGAVLSKIYALGMPAMTVFIGLIVKIMLFRHEFRIFRQFMFIKKAVHGIQIRVHSAGFADGLAWLFGRFKTADKVFGDFTHAAQRNVRRIFFLIGGEKAGVKANQRGLGQWLAATKRGIGNQSAA